MMGEFNEVHLAVLLQDIILFLSLQEFPHMIRYDGGGKILHTFSH